jgi:hypothetical protein
MSETADSSKIIELTQEYSTPYNTLIRDDVVMGVPRYFLERWVPVLGTNAATVVNTLRQLNYQCNNDTVTISGTALSREAAMSRRHLYTCLETVWISAFIRAQSGQRVRSKTGKITQKANSYTVRMDDPLTPADAEHLYNILLKLADTPLEAAQRALTYNARDLWAPDPGHPLKQFAQPRAITARDVLQRAFPTWTPPTEGAKRQFAQVAEDLHRHVTLVRSDGKTSKIIVPQYFRKRWWPLLGHDLAWAYLWLRGYVYDNPVEGIRRNTCWIPSLNTLLDIIGRPREWWRRNVEKHKPTGPWSLTDFFNQQDAQKGRDPANPQWVARQFWVALEIPIAPEDQERYAELLNAWHPTSPVKNPVQDAPPARSATFKHTGGGRVRHIQTHWRGEGPPHSNTPAQTRSAISEHTGAEGVRHIYAQRCATSTHSDSESNQASFKKNQKQNTTKHPLSSDFDSYAQNHAAAEIEKSTQTKADTLIDQIAEKLEDTPQTLLYACVTIDVWLQQAWLEPIRPHTPAWNAAITGLVSPRDLIALMLAIWADSAIQHPPRYLSWLIQRWQMQPSVAPVDQWERWQALAELPIGQWSDIGRREWFELTSSDNRALPLGLDALFTMAPPNESLSRLAARQAEIDEIKALQSHSRLSGKTDQGSNGLDHRPGSGVATIGDIWLATLDQLSMQINRSTHQDWIDGTKAVSYTNGILTVRAKHGMARDWLSKQLNDSIEATASALAKKPITIRYIS